MTARDGAARLLSAAVRLLPPARRDWGQAMRAELAGLAAGRWSFALGCTGTVLRQPAVLRSLAYSAFLAAAVAAVVVWSAGITQVALRWGVVALVGALAGVWWLGRVASPLGPVAGSRSARTVRGAGSLMVGVAALGLVVQFGRHGEQTQDAEFIVPVLTAILVCYLAGFLAVTAARSIASPRMLWVAVGSGVGGALLWLGFAVLLPPVPVSIKSALVMLVAAMVAAASLTPGGPGPRILVALAAGTVLTLLLLIELVLLSSYAPASMIPDLAPAALTAADDLAQSRNELQDPYVALLPVGALISLALGIVSVARRRRTAGRSTVGAP